MDRHAQHHPRSRACVLPNGLRLHLAHDPAASRAAAWLRVAAGSRARIPAWPTSSSTCRFSVARRFPATSA